MVWHFSASRLLGLLFRIPQATIPASSQDQYDPPPNSSPTMVYEYRALYVDGWHFTIRSCFHRAFLCVFCNLAKSVLLFIRIFILSFLHISCKLRPIIYRYDLFPIVWRGLQVSVFYLKIFVSINFLFPNLLRWWWRSFVVSGGSAVYILLYSIFYFFTKLEITEFIPTLLYVGYTGE